MAGIYWPEIRQILKPGLGCMANVVVTTEEGAFEVRLDDYETVKRLHRVIAGALNAYERDETGQWKAPPQATKRHAMPPGGPLPVEQVDKFLQWIEDGLPEGPATA